MNRQESHFVSSSLVLVDSYQRILLQLRKNTGYEDGRYVFPAGHVEKGENSKDALIREMKEEINITPENPQLLTIQERYNPQGERSYIDFYYLAYSWKGEIKNNEPEKCENLDFFGFDLIPERTSLQILPLIEFVAQKSLQKKKMV